MTVKTRTRGANSFKKALLKFNTDIKRAVKVGIPHRFTSGEAHEIYQRYGGRCVYCGIPLNIRAEKTVNSLRFKLHISIEYGGAIDKENVVIVCPEHDEKYKPVRHFREDILDINSFADLIQVLIKSVIKSEDQLKIKSPEYVLTIEKIRRIKSLLNLKIEDIAINMRYKPFKDWMPEKYEIIEEDKNSLPDLIEQQVKNVTSGESEDVLASDREKITEQTKQIITTKQYRIIRNSDIE